jgi:vibriolysin
MVLSGALFLATYPARAADLVTYNDQSPSIRKVYDINAMIKLNPSYDFKPFNHVLLKNGKNKQKIHQYYLSIPVWGVSLAATESNMGEYSDISGRYLVNIEQDLRSTQPSISKHEALTIAMKSKKITSALKAMVNNEEVNTYIMQDANHKARLVYQISFMINSHIPSRPYFIMDAQTGEMLRQWEGLTTQYAIGPGGNTKTGRYQYGTDYGYLIVSDTCQMISPNVETYDLKHKTTGAVIHQFDCTGHPPINTYQEINGAFSPINDAHYFGNVVFDMYQQWFDKSPLTMKLKLRVHYGENYQNAFWDGKQMTFGDGASTFYPLVGLDVVAHEVSHGFTQQNSNLIYVEQMGGINESFSDIAGEAAKYFNHANQPEHERNDWLVGGTIMKKGSALRYFSDPTKDGHSIGHAKDYHDKLDVHYSSGVFNRAFYTLATKADWNTEKAFRAFVLANQIYWDQESDFDHAGCGVKKAAQDLEYSVQDVVDAFNVVGVDTSCNFPPPPTASELKNNEPLLDLSGSQGNRAYYYVDVPSNTSLLTIKIFGGTGNADLYVHYNKLPSTHVFLCRPYTTGNNENCTFHAPHAGKYYVMLHGRNSYNGVTLAATY